MSRKVLYIVCILFPVFFACEEILLEDDISGQKVNLTAPSDNAKFYSTGITFSWDPVENGTQYRIQIAKPDFANAMQIVIDNVTDTTAFTTQLNVGNYEWRVQAVNSGYNTAFSSRKFNVVSNEDFESNTVTLSLPNDNLITNVPEQTLSWQQVLGTTAYRVQIVNSSGSTINEQDVTNTSLSYTFPEGSHTWKVSATNGEQVTMYSSRTLLIDATVPATPQLTTPANLSNTSDSNITFQWARTPVAGSTERDSIYIYKNNTLTNLQYKNVQTSPYITAALANGTYFWYVKSFDEAGNVSQQSTVFSFTLN